MKGSRAKVLFAASMVVLMAFGQTLTVLAQAPPPLSSTLQVFVGYADTETRGPGASACGNCFPSPWCGSTGIQFIGSSTAYNGNPNDPTNCKGGDWDTAALMVVDNGTTSVTLTNLTVTFPLPASGQVGSPYCPNPPRPVTFELWFGQQYYFDNRSAPAYLAGPITIPPAGEAIFAGTTSDGAYKCPSGNYPAGPGGSSNATYDFDTSDSNFVNGCTPTTDTVSDPRITLTATGYAPATIIDKGHAMDTGGIDAGNCGPTLADPQWGHEYLGWRLANSTCGEACPMNQLAATPTTSSSTTITSPSVGSTATSAPLTSAASSSAQKGGSANLDYATVALIVVVVVAVGYLGVRRGAKSESG